MENFMKSKKMIAKVVSLSLVLSMIFGMNVFAADPNAAYVDISTDHIDLSPQNNEVKMNVAAKNMPEGTELSVSVADANICTVEWVDLKEHGYTQLKYKRGGVLGETMVTVFVKDNPALSRQIKVTNKDVADTYYYEGNGNLDIYGLNMAPIPYQIAVQYDNANGYFGLTYNEGAGDSKVLLNKVGSYAGSVTLEKGTNATTFHVKAAGHWTMTLTPVLSTTTKNFAGTGDKVSGRFKGDGENHDVYCANYAGKGNYIVWLVDINDNTKTLLANGVGTYGKTKKKVYLSEYHSYYISVKSESNWTVDFGTGEAVTTLN